jgi:hypothetical protein
MTLQTGDAANFAFKNNVPDPLLLAKELPTFKFALEQSQGKVLGGSFGKEATVEELPISKGIAGVSMRLEPGVTRELHLHATAAEWAIGVLWIKPEDVAPVVAFLASDAARIVSCATYDVTGGNSARNTA